VSRRVAIVGIGYTPARTVTPDVSYRELTYDAAVKAYQDAGIEPRDVDSFVCCEEDFIEGVSITDEYAPDQLGAVMKPLHTVGGDGIHGVADACMEIMTGAYDIVVVEAHSKASNVLTMDHIVHYALDPVWNRPFRANPHFVAGLEMNRFCHETGTTAEQCSHVVVKNRKNALKNPSGAHAATLTVEDVSRSKPVSDPLRELDVAATSDAAFVVVLASAERAKTLKGRPVWVKGLGWCNDTPTLESRNWARAEYAELAAKQAYKMAGIRNPAGEIDLFEIDDSYAYKELQHLEALKVFDRGEAGKATERGITERTGRVPVNVSGGALGTGNMIDASGLSRIVEVTLQLRGQAGERQIPGARTALAMGWRGVPTTSGAIAILSADE
jgi:acetyl-CoA C-acetyltransferase